MSTNLLHSKKLFCERAKLSGSNIEVINNIEQVDKLFKWRGQNIYVQVYSQFESS